MEIPKLSSLAQRILRRPSQAEVQPGEGQPQDQVTLQNRPKASVSSRMSLVLAGISSIGLVAGSAALPAYVASQQMLLHHDPDLTPKEELLARRELEVLPRLALGSLAQSGAQIQITHNEAQAALLLNGGQEVDLVRLTSEGIRARQVVDQVQEYQQYRDLQAQRQELMTRFSRGGGGLTGGDELAKLDQSMLQLTQNQLKAAGLSQHWVQPYSEFPVSPNFLAATVEAASGQAEYKQLLRAVNGTHLEAGQKQTLQQLQEQIERVPDAGMRGFLQQQQQRLQADPDEIPVANLITPPVRYLKDGQRVVRVSRELAEFAESSAGYFVGSQSLIQVDENDLGNNRRTLTHEVGHALDSMLQTQDPEFHRDWHKRVTKAYEDSKALNAQGQQVAVSSHGLENTSEYVADGLATYQRDPRLLLEKDPKLYGLTEEMLQQAERQAYLPLVWSLATIAVSGVGLGMGLNNLKLSRSKEFDH